MPTIFLSASTMHAPTWVLQDVRRSAAATGQKQPWVFGALRREEGNGHEVVVPRQVVSALAGHCILPDAVSEARERGGRSHERERRKRHTRTSQPAKVRQPPRVLGQKQLYFASRDKSAARSPTSLRRVIPDARYLSGSSTSSSLASLSSSLASPSDPDSPEPSLESSLTSSSSSSTSSPSAIASFRQRRISSVRLYRYRSSASEHFEIPWQRDCLARAPVLCVHR